MKKRRFVIGILAAILLLPIHQTFTQGSLTPPAAPSPTMKTLDQVEARTIVNATNTPGDSSYAFIISQPGSYYLTGNFIAADSKGGINIMVSNVTLDLNGFTLSGGTTSMGAGINTPSSSVNNVTIRNGKVISWGKEGISARSSGRMTIEEIHAENNGRANTAIGIALGDQSHVRHCSAISNSQFGISGGYSSSVSDCESSANGGPGIAISSGIVSRCTSSSESGIQVSLDGVVSDCMVSHGGIVIVGAGGLPIAVVGCTVSYSPTDGIGAGDNATIERCSIASCTNLGINAGNNVTVERCNVESCGRMGISTGAGSTLRGCSVRLNAGHSFSVGDSCTLVDCTSSSSRGTASNGFNCGNGVTLSNCTAADNPGNGIVLGDHSTAQHCLASGNTGDGITATIECSVLNCNACANTGNGIHLLGGTNSNNRVDGNNASNNTGIGILQHGGPDLIVRNLARSNGSGTNYSPGSGTSVGPIGNYYLAGNITVASGDAIDINANGVTVDLNGFTISSTASSPSGNGIAISDRQNITMVNGFIQGTGFENSDGTFTGGGFAIGINSTPNASVGVLVSRISVSGCSLGGISLANSSTVEFSFVSNTGGAGIFASIVKNCYAKDCGSEAIQSDEVSDCFGQAYLGTAILSLVAKDCHGISNNSYGLQASVAENCLGVSFSATGLSATTASNCFGRSLSTNASDSGLVFTSGENCYGMGPIGISVLQAAQNCSAQGSVTGISLAAGGSLTGCSVSGASSQVGIIGGDSCTLSGCSVSGIANNGMKLGKGCNVANCLVNSCSGNGITADVGSSITNCTTRANTGNGIVLTTNSMAQNCTASANNGDGIGTTSGCTGSSILNCTASGNGVGGTHDGIHLVGLEKNNRVDGNNASNNTGIGIEQEDGPDLIVRNTARGNSSGVNYSPFSGSSVGPIGTPNTATSPWANFQ